MGLYRMALGRPVAVRMLWVVFLPALLGGVGSVWPGGGVVHRLVELELRVEGDLQDVDDQVEEDDQRRVKHHYA